MWLSRKIGINCGNTNAPSHYVDITIPSTDTSNCINVANTYGGLPVMYVDCNGNVSMSGSLTSSSVNVTSTGVVLPTTYTLSLPGVGSMGYIQSATSSTISLTSATYTNMASMSLSAGVWILIGTVSYATASGATNSNVLYVSANISTSSTSNDASASISRVQCLNFNFTYNNALTRVSTVTTRFVSLTSTTTMYLNAYAYFATGTLQALNLSKLYAVRIQ